MAQTIKSKETGNIEIVREVKINDLTQTKKFGEELAGRLAPGTVIGLIGDLGTGKTAFTKYIASGLGFKGSVTSPTFTIIQEYRGGRLPLFHFDVYRLGGADEMFELGYEEYFDGDGICVIEWADMIEELLPEDALIIYIEYGKNEGERIYKCSF